MTLPASGEITLNDVNVELGNTGTDAITIGSADVRDLFGVASGEITMADGYGKSSVFSIANSCRFNDNDTAYLSRTPSSGGNNRTWTWSGWVKRGNLLLNGVSLFSAGNGSSVYDSIHFDEYDSIEVFEYGGGFAYRLYTTQKFRDPSAFYHIVLAVDTTQSTEANRVKLYVNGEQVTDFDTENYPSQNHDCYTNDTSYQHEIGHRNTAGSSQGFFDGYLAEVNFIDGTALTPSSFGETGDYGEWKPIEYTGSYGTNGFYLDFADSGDLGDDESGNGNDFTENNLSATDQVLDSPTNNFATWNPLLIYYPGYASIFSEGNLKGGHDDNGCVFGSIVMTTGKWYAEMYFEDDAVDHNMAAVFAVATTTTSSNSTIERGISYKDNGDKVVDGTTTSYGATYSTGDIIGIAVDADAGNVTFYKNNTSQGSTSLGAGDDHVFACGGWNGTWYWVANFGQDSSFAGNKTAQGNQDSNGIGDFYYTPPTDYLALCTSNLPDVDIVPSEHFNAVTYSGNGSSQSITGVGFQPDFVWGKIRSGENSHALQDVLRGQSKTLFSDSNVAESEYGTNVMSSFDSDGFSVGGYGLMNDNSATYVAWNWKANGSGSSNTDGSITSTVSANADAGFSIAAFTGTGSNATVGHGLSSAPEMVIVKNRGAANDWHVYVEPLGATDVLIMNLNYAKSSTANAFNSTAPTSTVFSVGSNGGTNQSSKTMVAYCFHSVDGYSKVGSYVGNANADGTFVYTGFRPAFVMIKSASNSAPWAMWDSKRDIDNSVVENIRANDNAAEYTSGSNIGDFTANGFKLRGTGGDVNSSSGYTYIYLAFAETPFKYSNAR